MAEFSISHDLTQEGISDVSSYFFYCAPINPQNAVFLRGCILHGFCNIKHSTCTHTEVLFLEKLWDFTALFFSSPLNSSWGYEEQGCLSGGVFV